MSARAALVISAFRADEAIIRLLEAAHAVVDPPWSGICVVDSLGSGHIARHVEARGWTDVVYRTHAVNLGSAGNLAERLRWAASEGFDYAYAINHDGDLVSDVVRGLVAEAERRRSAGGRVGAIYPLRRYVGRGSQYDLTGKTRLPVPFIGTASRPAHSFRVFWASSNGALYSLGPVRAGLLPWADFWMGWEDLAYGWLLDDHGYEQWVDAKVVIDDDYETRAVTQRLVVTEKPVWYAYYQTRNLLLASRRTKQSTVARALLLARFAMECGLTLAVRKDKTRRLRLLSQGVRDGLLDVSGKGPVP